MKHSINFLDVFHKRFSCHKSFLKTLALLENYTNPFSISGLSGSFLSLFTSSLSKTISKSIFLLFDNIKEAEDIRDDLDFFLGESMVCFLPDPECHKTLFTNLNSISTYFYNDAVSKITSNINPVIVSTVRGLSAKLPSPEFSTSNTIKLEVNKPFDRDLFIQLLMNFGYNREITIEYPLEFSIKGGIVDFYPPNSINPYRIEFYDNTIESIRSFNTEDQLSIKQIRSLTITPPSNPKFDEKDTASILSYLDAGSILITSHYEIINDSLPKNHPHLQELSQYKRINLHDYIKSDLYFRVDYPIFSEGKISAFRKHLSLIKPKIRTPLFYLICSNQSQAERLRALLGDLDLRIVEGFISQSIEFHDISIYIYAEHDIYSRSRKTNTFKKLSKDIPIQHIEAERIDPGDTMVHINYGIGKYLGLEKIHAFDSVRECLSLEYHGGDKVYVPLEKIKNVQKYRAANGFTPVLNKLGSSEWEKNKLKTSRSLEKITKEIIRLYALRMRSKGFPFDCDSDLQIEMESEFIYYETPDQITATKEIKKDMEAPRPMDRLLCGDVGFGKTEVTIRAAFKAVSNSKQVAILVPTTILADQHYNTFFERLKNYPINISLLSRFISKKNQHKVLKELAEGSADIVIGTHRLFSEDVHFKDLGLLIIDEEQRFGVKHKDKIKNLRSNIDILSLSATPIPRTLQFSLIGARDFSNINTPPKSRLPIYTEIITNNKEIVRAAVNREISRGGQIYFVHNEIKSIASITSKLKDLCPDIRIGYAHGQMREREIEPIMNSFINRNIDLLVTTTIIESGIDIPNVNTIFINRAHNLGLAQLYQLRGRVGRANRRAYAYLIVPHMGRLNQKAIKRLQNIQRYTSLGSGYSIAIKDLELRGAGNIFGLEQSGYIQSIGYDLYAKILKESLEELNQDEGASQNIKPIRLEDVEIVYHYPSYFPDYYISSSSIRLDFYRRLSESDDSSKVDEIELELKDRFGKIPPEGISLFEISRIRILSITLGISKIIFSKNSAHIFITDLNPFKSTERLTSLIKMSSGRIGVFYKFLPGSELQLILFYNNKSPIDTIKHFLYLLIETINL